jgi:putative sterol carrier protein
MALNPENLETMQAAEFVALVKSTSDSEIAADFAGDHRVPLLDALFARFPHVFRPENAGGRKARINFTVTGGPGGSSDTYAVVVADGTCTVEKGPATPPDLTLTLGPADFLKLITGTSNPAMMFMTGKVKASGDLVLATGLANWFEAPKA